MLSVQIFDPANFTGLIEEVYLDGVGLISNETRDECLTSNIVANNCFRAFLSGFTLANRVGPWSVGESYLITYQTVLTVMG